jgi:hypothetical protein
VGHSAIRVAGAFFQFNDGLESPLLVQKGDQLPTTLEQGEMIRVEWELADVERFLRVESIVTILACGFHDTLGNRFVAPYPGVAVKRRGWRRKRALVPM